MMKKFIALSFLAVLMVAGIARAEQTTFDQSITLAQPFAIAQVDNAALGTLYVTGSAETVTVDATSIVPVVSAVSAAAANGAVVHTAGQISRGGPPYSITSETAAVIAVQALQADVDIALAIVGTPTLDIPFSAAPTPINVTGLTSNVAALNAATIAANSWATLVIGPVFDVPANAEVGAYSGTVTVDITAL